MWGKFVTCLFHRGEKHLVGFQIRLEVLRRDLAPADIESRIRERVDAGAVVIFTDLQGGSCTMAARRVQRAVPGVIVVTGFNLSTLIDFAVHGELALDEAVARSVERGRCALVLIGSTGAS